MSGTMNEPLLGGQEGTQSRVPDSVKKGCKKCLLYVGGVLLVLFAIAGIIQLICYNFALLGCSASKLSGYQFPGGGTSDEGGPAYNLVPRVALLIERDPVWWGEGYDLFPSDSASTISGATTGFFYKTWGPLFNTYAYEDTASSKVTMYMRQRFPQSYLFMSHVIARCDGNGPSVIVTEGSGGFIVNRIRALFKMNQGYHFQVWVDDTFVGVAQEIGQHGSGVPSILFRNSTGATMGSSTLQSRHFHGNKDEWLVTNEEDTKIPYYANAALTLNYAFHVHNHDIGKQDHPLKSDKPSLEAIVGDRTEPEQATPEESKDKSADEATASLATEVQKIYTLADADKEPETVAVEVPTEEGQTKVVTEDVDQAKGDKSKDEPKLSNEEPEPKTDKTAESQSKSEEKADAEEKKWEEKGREEEEKGREKGRAEEEKYRNEEQEYRREERANELSNREQVEKHAEEKEEEPSTAKDKDSSKEEPVSVTVVS